MKNLHWMAVVGLVALLGSGRPANAALLPGTDPRFGLNSLTIDTESQLAWLDLPQSAGLTYQQALAQTGPGGLFSGFRFATATEVLSLYHAAGIPSEGYYPLSTPEIGSLFSLVGATGSFNGEPMLIGNSATAQSAGAQLAPSIYSTGVFGQGTVNDYVYSVNVTHATAYGQTYGFAELGNWLVMSVPEPGVEVLGLMGLIGLARRRR